MPVSARTRTLLAGKTSRIGVEVLDRWPGHRQLGRSRRGQNPDKDDKDKDVCEKKSLTRPISRIRAGTLG